MAGPYDLSELRATIAVHAQQIGRIVSDIESEKRTRANMNTTILERLSDQDKQYHESAAFQNKLMGAIITLNVLLGLGVAIWAARGH